MNPCSPYTLRTGNSPPRHSGEHRIHHTGRHQTGAGKTDPLYHTIRRGDYLGKIARQYGTTVKRLCQLNNISEDAIIREGRKLRVR